MRTLATRWLTVLLAIACAQAGLARTPGQDVKKGPETTKSLSQHQNQLAVNGLQNQQASAIRPHPNPLPEGEGTIGIGSNSIGMKLAPIPAGEFLMGGREPAEELVKAFAAYNRKPDFFKENGKQAEAADASLPDAAQVVQNLNRLGTAVKLDDRGNAVAVDFSRARLDGFDMSRLAALPNVKSLKFFRQPIADADRVSAPRPHPNHRCRAETLDRIGQTPRAARHAHQSNRRRRRTASAGFAKVQRQALVSLQQSAGAKGDSPPGSA